MKPMSPSIYKCATPMIPSILIAVLCWTFSLFFGAAASAAEIQFMTHNLSGETYTDEKDDIRGKRHGGRRAFHVELVREIMQLAERRLHLIEVPFARGMRLVQTRDDLALFNVTRTREREPAVKWVGPIQSTTNYFFEATEHPTGIQTLEDAKNVAQIVVLNENIHHRFLLRQGFDNLHTVNSYVACLKMLAHGRAQLTPLSNVSLTHRLAEAGLTSGAVRQTPVVLFKKDGYIALSKNIPDNVVARLQDSLDELKRSGRYDVLYRNYFEAGDK